MGLLFTNWIKDLPYYKKIPVQHRKFLTRFKDYDEFLKAYYVLCQDCKFFSIDLPLNSNGKANPLGVIELMVEFAELEKEYD